MRSGLLAFGIILLIVGVLFLMVGYNAVQDHQSTLGQIGRVFSESRRQEYQTYMIMEMGGAILAVVGFVLSISGAVIDRSVLFVILIITVITSVAIIGKTSKEESTLSRCL